MISVFAMWLLAAVAIIIRKHQQVLADAAMTFVVCMLSFLALDTQQPNPGPRPTTVEPQPGRLDPQAVKIEAAYVGSSIGKAYHLPDCFYAKQQTKHLVTFATREQAEATGRHACTNCIHNGTIAHNGKE